MKIINSNSKLPEGEKKRALIFDLDGVLVNTVEAHYFGWSAVTRELDIPFTREDNEKFRGISRKNVMNELMRRANTRLSQEKIDQLLDLKVKCYREYVLTNPEKIKINGVGYLLKELKINGYALGLSSASKNASLLLEITGILSFFEIISDGHFKGKLKPEPDQLLFIASELQVSPRNCIVLDDSIVGLQAAKRADMIVAAVGNYAVNFKEYDLYYDSLHSLSVHQFIETLQGIQ